MQASRIKDKLVEDLTGRSESHKTGIILGFFFSLGILSVLGGGLYLWGCITSKNEPSAGGAIVAVFLTLLASFGIAALGAKFGLLKSEINMEGLKELTRDEYDVLADYGFHSPYYHEEREREVQALGFGLATFQFLFGTLWSCFTYLCLPSQLPEQGLRAATAVIQYLKQAGRVSQDKLTKGMAEAGMNEQDTRAGLLFLKQRGYVVGAAEGYVVTEKTKLLFGEQS